MDLLSFGLLIAKMQRYRNTWTANEIAGQLRPDTEKPSDVIVLNSVTSQQQSESYVYAAFLGGSNVLCLVCLSFVI